MKLTKKLEAEVRKVYEAFWESLLSVNMRRFNSFLDANFRQIGTTETEFFFSKREAARFLKATEEQVIGNIELRNRQIRIEPVDSSILIIEQSDAYVKIDTNWVFYAKTRATSLLQKKAGKWKFIQQHISVPDNRTQEGETIALEQIKTENLQLRDAVRRRTIELEEKNRELKIESALERVRTRTMAMQKSDELTDVASLLFKQVSGLGIKTWTTGFNVWSDDNNFYTDYVTNPQGGFIEPYTIDTTQFVVFTQVSDAKKRGDEFFVNYQDGALIEETYRQLTRFGEKQFNSLLDSGFQFPTKQYGHFVFGSKVSLLFVTYEPVPEAHDIFKRFGKVFEQTYTRFADLKKAEAQAREAQIQLALERVRARTMAMHNSDELAEVAALLFEQVKHLGVETYASGFNIWDKEHINLVSWMSNPTGSINPPFEMPIHAYDQHSRIYASWKNHESFIVDDLTGGALTEHYRFLRSFPLLDEAFRRSEEAGIKTPDRQVHNNANFSSGYLLFITPEPCPQYHDIFKRFAKVFEQTYTRFIDLQKAEAQARESQIQLALERVRARTMAMQKSDELRDVASLLFKQLEYLGVTSWSSGFNIWEDDGRSATINMCNPDGSIATPYHLPHTEDIFFIKICEARQRHEDLLVMETGGKELEETYNYMFSLPEVKKMLGGMEDTGFQIPKFQVNHCAFFSQGYLMFITYEPVPEMWDVFKRFAKVFEQTYTRFLDLQKAEAQAREAKIEAALEKVRSRTMAMQRSDELSEAASLLFQQVQSLGAAQWTAGYCIFDEDKRAITLWMSGPWGEIQPSFRAPLDENPSFINYLEAHNKGLEMYIEENSAKVNGENYQYLLTLPVVGERLNSIIAKGLPLPTYQVDHCAYFSKGFLLFITYQQVPELHSVFKRFAAVFDQTYTRFLDLQKAETQAREAQIEASLERVRSRAMAMRTSEELNELIGTVFTELTKLDLVLTRCVILIYEGTEKGVRWWMANSEAPAMPMNFFVTYADMPFFNEYLKGWQERSLKWQYILDGENKLKTDEFLFHDTELSLLPDFVVAGMRAPERIYLNASFNNFGNLTLASLEPLSQEHSDILLRFAKVFDLTYTRFNDLKQAEAQAREAQIELGLERVRARTMAMHHSDELTDVVKLLYQEFDKLKISNESTDIEIGLIDEKTGIASVWAHLYLSDGTISTFKFPVTHFDEPRKEFEEWKATPLKKRNELFFTMDLSGERYQDFVDIVVELPELSEIFKPLIEAKITKWVTHNAYFSHGFLTLQGTEAYSPQTQEIQKRFAKVFEQTYTRFLDLQKAEAQVREAKIEAALEKIRSRSLAMHHSNEIGNVVTILFEKLKELGLTFDGGAGIHLFTEGSRNAVICVAAPDLPSPIFNDLPYDEIAFVDNPIILDVWKSKDTGEHIINRHYSFEQKNTYFQYLFRYNDHSKLPQPVRDFILNAGSYTATFISEKNSLLGASSWTDEVFSEADVEVLKRVARVFEQAYIRFLDLQKAEAQAREAQIEVALERTRTQSMIMQHSKELDDTLRVFHEQVLLLGINSAFSFLWLPDEEKDRHIFWAAWGEDLSPGSTGGQEGLPPGQAGKNRSTVFKSKAINYPLDRNEPATAQCLVDWKSNEPVYSYYVPPAAVENYFAAWQELIYEVKHLKPEYFSGGLHYVEAFMKYGCFGVMVATDLTDDEKKILGRFAIEFERTYTRFLDLQKAEAQAKEARIEAALEKVRSRTMGMQKSEELKEVIQVVYEQFVHLNIHIEHTGFIMDYKARDDMHIWLADKHEVPFQVTIPYFDCAHWNSFKDAKEKGKDFFANHLSFEEKNKFYKDLFKLIPGVPEETLEYYFNCPGLAISTVLLENVGLYIENFSGIPYSDEENNTLMRFGKVFQQTYTRFLDLQKAEAQAREAQIELGLERVRASAMAMHNTEGLYDTAEIVYKELLKLGIESSSSGFGLIDENAKKVSFYGINPTDGKIFRYASFVPLTETKVMNSFRLAWKNQVTSHVIELNKQETVEHETYVAKCALVSLKENGIKPSFTIEEWLASSPKEVKLHFFNFRQGCLYSVGDKRLTDVQEEIVIRFTKAFQLTYTRFLDLQKAEAQAREAQIEAALERVRSRSMGMQKSEELREVIQVIYEQLEQLNFEISNAGFLMDYRESDDGNIWMTDATTEFPTKQHVPWFDHPFNDDYLEQRDNGPELFTKVYPFEEKNTWWEVVLNYLPGVSEETKKILLSSPALALSRVLMKNIGLYLLNYAGAPYSEAENATLIRFGKVFEQTYTRFNDLKQAEAQAKEAQIEAALEKVRSRTMAMQRSAELAEVATVLFQQVKALGVPQWVCGFSIFEIDDKEFTWYPGDADGAILPPNKIPLTEHPVFISFNESRKRGDELFVYEKGGEFQADHYRYMRSLPGGEEMYQNALKTGITFPAFQIDHIANFSHGNLVFITYEHFPEMHDVFKRFARVFDQTYTRFLDLQKSEAQTREAKIEAALEKVRSRTMAMQRSAELAEVATVLFQQVKALGVPQWVCGFSIFEIDDKEFTWYPGSADGDILTPVKVPLTEHPVFISINESRKRGDELFVYEKGGEYQAGHYRYMQSLPGMGGLLQEKLDSGFTIPNFQIDHVANFSHGNLLFITYEHFPEMHDVFKRFAKVFDQTYTRFLDLQKAEAQAREAVKQASVDRVRAEIASMRTTNDLERITPLIWNELTTLGVPFIRCGVFIMDEEQKQVQSFLSTPDGKAIAAFRQPYNSPGEIAQVVEHWHTKKMYRQHWSEAQFIEFTKNLVQQGVVSSDEKYFTENRPTDLYLHFIPFLQGMLYAGSTCALSDDELGLMQDLADAFSTAYARYEDFNKLEAAKETVEQTLVDLKQAQQQLVQSEKMASLGELTAGIAHEIQNPLNFVNNFSEVNRELLSEMKAEIEKGNIEEVKAIANDIIGNEEKINHHGKRADAIVKGMLQHSRMSSGQKEPTDINAICDEYLRLAYHGLRAKDKSFNAKFETNLDTGIGKINVIPQDIGRVLVNLINNAFYAVSAKASAAADAAPLSRPGGTQDPIYKHDPTVWVITKKVNGTVEVHVKDNGPGIPQKVLDKIFQPFFTTKPTGQGTGLGLSLAYDIVKAHGGEIKVETREGEGTTFIMSIPENSYQ